MFVIEVQRNLDYQTKFLSVKLLIFSYPSFLSYVLGAQQNCLIETVLLSTNNKMFWLRNKNFFFFVYTLNSRPVYPFKSIYQINQMSKSVI